jgi:hypothetical protein
MAMAPGPGNGVERHFRFQRLTREVKAMNEKNTSTIRQLRCKTKVGKGETASSYTTWRKLLGCAGTALVLGATSAAAQLSRESWYFSAAEIGAAYQYQESYGGRMRNPLPAFRCMTGKANFVTTYRGASVQVACQFVNQVTRHLKDMLAIGAARYLFPLDADHAHLAVPAAVWAERYDKLSAERLMEALLREPKLVALYHTAEHLAPDIKVNGKDDASVRRWREQRNLLGYFDGRPLQVLPAHPEGFGVGLPDGLIGYGGFNFLASRRGELMILQGQRAISFDLSLEMEEPEPNFSGRSLAKVVPAVQGKVER